MFTPPDRVSGDDVLHAVRCHWLVDASTAIHLPVGFGAHHWQVVGADGRRLFVTLDALAPRHSAASLEGAYAGAAALADAGVPAVWPPLVAPSGRFTVEFDGGALSATGWLDGRTPSPDEAAGPHLIRPLIGALAALHAAAAPAGLPRWVSRFDTGFAEHLGVATGTPWAAGPLGETARAAIRDRLTDIAHWTSRYAELAAEANRNRGSWVPTHGEPHHANQLIAADDLWLVDWESLALAPRERDLVDLLRRPGEGAAGQLRPDWAMVELFVLDWRLTEIDTYAEWFSRPHSDGPDDRTALHGLRTELQRPIEALRRRRRG